MKTHKKETKNIDNVINIVKTTAGVITSAALGFAIGWLFEGKELLALVLFFVIGLFVLIAWIFTVVYEKRVSILEILNNDIKTGKYQEAVKLGYSVSRALFLAGRNYDRYKISEKVCEALEKIEGTISLNGVEENVHFLKAKMLIDDCGWSLYLVDRFSYRKKAEQKIKEGINECLRLKNIGINDEKIFSTVFKGLRHLFGMCIENFDQTEKHILQSNSSLVHEYIIDINKYGGLLGFLLNDKTMFDEKEEEDFFETFNKITLEATNSKIFFYELRNWCDKSLKDKKFLLTTYNFKSKFYFGLYEANNILNSDVAKQNNYLDLAQETAVLMTLGYSKSPNDYAWLKETYLYVDELEKYKDYACIQQDGERVVKGFVLLGKVAMRYNNLQAFKDAETAFIHAINASRLVNRIDTYISAQRCVVSLNERRYRLKCSLELIKGEEQIEELEKLCTIMDSIQKETKSYLGFLDERLNESCLLRKKKYKEEIKKIKKEKISK